MNGHLEVLQWVRENDATGEVWNERLVRTHAAGWAQEAGGADVVGRTQWSVKSLQCIQAMSVQGTACAVPQEATNMVTMMHFICTIFLSYLQCCCIHENICHVHLEDVV